VLTKVPGSDLVNRNGTMRMWVRMLTRMLINGDGLR
jgi:hypothetical protein